MRIPKKPRIYIRDQRDVVVDVLRPKDYYDTNLGSYMKGNTARFKFTMIKKPTTFADLTVVNNLAFRYDNVDYWLACMIIDQNETTATVEAWPLGLEWANEEIGPYKAGSAMTFEQYFNLLSYQKSIVLNINEVDEKKITYEWDGTQTKLERLYSLATVFNAEIEFKTELNADGSLLRQVLNVYKEHDDNNQGMGLDRRNEVFRYGKDIKSINYNVDKTELKTAIIGTGKDGLTIASIEAEVKDADGNLLYATYKTAKPGMEDPKKIYAVQAVEQFPSQTNISDKWTVAIAGDSDHTTAQALYGYLLSELKKLSTPNVTWDVQGWVDGNVGDTIRIRDDGYQPPLLLEARISEQHRDLDDPSQNTTTFTNVEILKSKLSQNIMAQVAALIEANKQYQASIETEGGFAFKNNQGQSIFHAVIRDGALDVTDKFKLQWYKDSVYIGNAKDITVLGTDIVDKSLYYYEYYDDTNTLRGRVELTVTNTNDGAPGKDGKDGINGTDGVPGKDGVGLLDTEVKWAQSTSGTVSPSTGWQEQVPTLIKGQYLWTRTIWYYTDGTNETGFTVSYNAKDGNDGTDGVAGKDGVGITDTLIEYAVNTSGVVKPTSGWTTAIPSTPQGQYLWTRTTWTYSDNTTEQGFTVARQGNNGTNGVDGQTFYPHHGYLMADGTLVNQVPNENLAVNSKAPNAIAYWGATMTKTPNVAVTEWGATDAVQYAFTGGSSTIACTIPAGGNTTPGVKEDYDISIYVKNTGTVAFTIGGNITSSVRIEPGESRRVTFLVKQYSHPTGAARQFSFTRLTTGAAIEFIIWKAKFAYGTYNSIWTPRPVEDYENAYPKYEGFYSDTNQADSTDPDKYKPWVPFIGQKGKDGIDGIAGKDGVGVSDTTITYAQTTSGTIPPTTGWTAQVPTLVKGQYLWTRTVWTYTDNSTETGYTVSYNAKDGNDGTDGKAGKDGVGISSTKVEYVGSTSGTIPPTTGWSTTIPTVAEGNYLWTRTTWTYTDNTSEMGYSVAKMGPKGDKGDKGDNAPTISLSGATQVITVSKTGVITPSSSFTVVGTPVNTTITTWLYSVDGGAFVTTLPTGVTRSTNTVTINPATSTFKTLSIRAADATVMDIFTVARIIEARDGVAGKDGTNGTNGSNGADGKDAYTVILSNEAYTFPGSTTGALAGSTTTTISIYKGITKVNPTAITVGTKPTGMTSIVSGLTTAIVTFTVTTAMVTKGGTVPIDIVVDGITFTKLFSYAISLQGIKGTDGGIGPQGPPGVDGKEVFSGYLSNDSILVPANNAGTVTDFSKANGTFTTFLGQVQLTSGVTYSLVSNSGLTSTINATTGAYSVTAISADTATATYKAVYNGITIQKILIVTKAKQGPTGASGTPGAKGDPTGIIAQTTAPTSPYVGMLWKNTTAGNGATYRWTGSSWEAYVFTAVNISAENLAAITGRIGELYNDYTRTYNDGTSAIGTLAIKDAEINNSGVIKNSAGTTIQTYESIVSHQLISMARYSGAGSVGDQNKLVASLGITFNSIVLNDRENGFSGQITAEQLTNVPWTTLPLAAGFAETEGATPQYRKIQNIDGSFSVQLRGRCGPTTGSFTAGAGTRIGTLPVGTRPTRLAMFPVAFSGGFIGRLQVELNGDLMVQVNQTGRTVTMIDGIVLPLG